jgi:hypothetical protein
MMQGISTLPGAAQTPQVPQAPQGAEQAPGQAAPFQAMPPAQPQTPTAITGQLENMPPQQLLQMFANPADKTPKWAVVTAYAKAVEQQRLMEAASGQAAMQQAQMQAQQPPVAMQVMSQPLTPPAPPVQMARHGGIMHGYAGGGAVAFANGTGPQGLDSRQLYGSFDPATSEAALALDALRSSEAQKAARIRELEEQERFLRSAGAPQAALVAQEIARLKGGAPDVAQPQASFRPSQNYGDAELPPQLPPSLPSRPGPGPGPGPGPRVAAPLAQRAAPESGLAGLMGPQIEPERLAAREAQQGVERALTGAGPTAAQTQAREGLDALMKQVIGERQAEEARRLAQAQSRVAEAQQRAGRSPLEDVTYLGQMLEGMRGSKRFGEALAGAASGAGRAQTARQDALRRAEERYDMSRNEIATLASLRQQLQIDQARAAQERASGDARAAQDAAIRVAQSRQQLAEFEAGLADKAEGRKIERERMALTASEGEANRAASAAVARIQAAARSDPASKEAAAVARVQAAINSSPVLKELAKNAGMGIPGAQEQYRVEEARLYLRLAPELLIGTAGTAGGQGSARAAADAILQSGR